MKSTKDDRDGFDVVAEFIFQVRLTPLDAVLIRTCQQRSDATSVLLHHHDIQDFLQVRPCVRNLTDFLTRFRGAKRRR